MELHEWEIFYDPSSKKKKEAVPRGGAPAHPAIKVHPLTKIFPLPDGRHYKGLSWLWAAQSFKRQAMSTQGVTSMQENHLESSISCVIFNDLSLHNVFQNSLRVAAGPHHGHGLGNGRLLWHQLLPAGHSFHHAWHRTQLQRRLQQRR